jgi:SP family sugar porter-like MFS transporter
MVFGFAGLALIYVIIGYCYHLKEAGTVVAPALFLVLVLAAIGTYAMSLAPVTWVIISEIFPNRIRGAAMAVAVMALWLACFILTYTFPILNASLGASGTFWLYGVICVLGGVFVFAKLPETNGRTLEEIERDLTGNQP